MKLGELQARFEALERWLIPPRIYRCLNAEARGIRDFMIRSAQQIAAGSHVLDAGAGTKPYAGLFAHTRYESTDYAGSQHTKTLHTHDYLCCLDNIPRPDNTYDAILNTQVLEHVRDPLAVIKELYRILKPGGSLYLTAPQGWGLHEAPHHYFNFTQYGLNLLFEQAGFEVADISARGGAMWYLGYRLKSMPFEVLRQHLFVHEPGQGSKIRPDRYGLVLLPVYLALFPVLRYLVPLACHLLDGLDREQNFTLGYACRAIKPIQTVSN